MQAHRGCDVHTLRWRMMQRTISDLDAGLTLQLVKEQLCRPCHIRKDKLLDGDLLTGPDDMATLQERPTDELAEEAGATGDDNARHADLCRTLPSRETRPRDSPTPQGSRRTRLRRRILHIHTP